MTISRKEHLEWCKQRAREYLERRDYQGAIGSMLSDLGKHPKTVSSQKAGGIVMLATMMSGPTYESTKRFIERFN